MLSEQGQISKSSQEQGQGASAPKRKSRRDSALSEISPLIKSDGEGRKRSSRRHTIITADLAELHTNKWLISDAEGTMSEAAFVINMFADMCPLGFLPLSSGLKHTGYVPALILLFVVCVMCIYTLSIVGETAMITGKNTFRGQWEVTFGKRFAFVPVLVIILAAMGACLAYSCICADLFADALPTFGVNLSRDSCLCIFTFLILMPLCMLKDLSALSYSSAAAFLLVTYAAGIMVLRAADGTYADGGVFFKHMKVRPAVPKHHLFGAGLDSINLVNYLAMAFLAHCNGCKYYRELVKSTPTRMRRHSSYAMALTAAFYLVMMIAGFQTFGMTAEDVILNNYAKADTLSNLGQLGVACSILAAFPLMFCSLREAMIDLVCIFSPDKQEQTETNMFQDLLSVVVLWFITLLAHIFTEAGMVVGVVGSVCGSAIIYIVPCVLYEAALEKFCVKQNHETKTKIVRILSVVGVVLAVLGCISALHLIPKHLGSR